MNLSGIAILASGEGTTAEAYIKASFFSKGIPKVKLVISNKKDAGIFQRVETLNKKYKTDIKLMHIGRDNFPAAKDEILRPGDQSIAEEMALIDALNKSDVKLIVLMGYMKRLGRKIVHEFGWHDEYTSPFQSKLLNTHPGLLPDTKGLYGINVQQFVLDKKLPYGGQTLHVVAENYDEGPVIAEHKVAVKPGDTPETLFERVKITEKQYIPKDVGDFMKRRRKYLK